MLQLWVFMLNRKTYTCKQYYNGCNYFCSKKCVTIYCSLSAGKPFLLKHCMCFHEEQSKRDSCWFKLYRNEHFQTNFLFSILYVLTLLISSIIIPKGSEAEWMHQPLSCSSEELTIWFFFNFWDKQVEGRRAEVKDTYNHTNYHIVVYVVLICL